MEEENNTIDVWMQHPTLTFSNHPMFDSLRRWTKTEKLTEAIPLELTLSAMDQGQVGKGLICAWGSPQGFLISNEDVYSAVQQFPDRLVGIASVDLFRPMEAVRDLRRCVKDSGSRGFELFNGYGIYPLRIEDITPFMRNASNSISPPACRLVILVLYVLPNQVARSLISMK